MKVSQGLDSIATYVLISLFFDKKVDDAESGQYLLSFSISMEIRLSQGTNISA